MASGRFNKPQQSFLISDTLSAAQQQLQNQVLIKLPYYTGGYVYNPPTTTTPAAPTTTTGPATAVAGPSANLQALLAAIPIAADGQVIMADFHNSLRAALITLAGEIGLGLTAPTTTFTFMPAFLPTGAGANWNSTNFVATSAANINPDGWLPVQLPDGQRIQSLTVTGKTSGAAAKTFQVKLLRQLTTGQGSDAPTALITIDLAAQTGSFSVDGAVIAAAAANTKASVANLAAADDLKTIDTTNYKYFVQASMTGAGKDTVNEIDAIQITVSQ